jgi:glycolate oxidase
MSFETRLASLLPRGAVLTSDEAKRPYECDGLSAYHQIPRVVVVPETRAEVEQVVKLCAEYAVPLVTRGAGTGLSGGALPLADGCC